MGINVGDSVDWTYNGLTTECTLLAIYPGGTHGHIQYVGTRGLSTARVPLGELELTQGEGLRMYRVDADADTLQLLKTVLRDIGVRVIAQYPHYTVVATNEPNKLVVLRDNLPGMTTTRLPGRYRA